MPRRPSVGLKRKAVPMCRGTLWRSPPTLKLLANLAFKPVLVFGIGWVADTLCGRPLVCLWPLPLELTTSARFWQVRMPWISIFCMPMLRKICPFV